MLLRRPRTAIRARGARQAVPVARSIMTAVTGSGYHQAMSGVITQFRWFMTACATGLYVGLIVGGLLAIVRGDVTEARRLLLAAPVLIVLGTLAGRWVARRTSDWLLATLSGRTTRFAAVGAISMPLAACVGQLTVSDTTFGVVVLLPGCVTGALYLLAARRARRHAAIERARRAQQERQLLDELLRIARTNSGERDTAQSRR